MLVWLGTALSYAVVAVLLVSQVISNLLSKKYKKVLYKWQGQYMKEVIGGYETEYMLIPKKTSNINENNLENNEDLEDITIILVPGNPGYIKFYDRFLSDLASQLQYRYNIYGVSHIGHSTLAKSNTRRGANVLTEQIAHKRAFAELLLYRYPKTKILLLSHSIGAYIVLNILEYLPKERVIHSFKLFPTIEQMHIVPNYFFANCITSFPIRIFVASFAYLLSKLPRNILRVVASLALSNSEQKEFIHDGIEAVCDFLNFSIVNNISIMAQSEFAQVRNRQDHLLIKHADIITLQYGQSDGWTPLQLYQDMKSSLPNINVILDQEGLEHAFVIGGASKQAELLAQQITNLSSLEPNNIISSSE